MAAADARRAIARLGGPSRAAEVVGVDARLLQRAMKGKAELAPGLEADLIEAAGGAPILFSAAGLERLAAAIEERTARHGAPPILRALAALSRADAVPLLDLRRIVSRNNDATSSGARELVDLLAAIGLVEIVDDVEKAGGPRSRKLVRLTAGGLRMVTAGPS